MWQKLHFKKKHQKPPEISSVKAFCITKTTVTYFGVF